ncbi:MAG TPA: hypothetical protein VF691_01250 [Cytophagaceae bacterium]|jgi:hypothetical protein
MFTNSTVTSYKPFVDTVSSFAKLVEEDNIDVFGDDDGRSLDAD